MSVERQAVTLIIIRALRRMRQRGHEKTEGYQNLERKLDAINQGCEYKVTDITEKLIMSYGAMIPTCNMLTRNNPIYSVKKTIEAKTYLATVWGEP